MRRYCKGRPVIMLLMGIVLILSNAFAQNQDELKSDIYSKFKCCACQVSFDKCSCREAREMKAYIDALLESEAKEEEIFYKVAKKFSLNSILDDEIKAKIEKRLILDTDGERPQIILEPPVFDFGQVNKSQGKISKIFKLHNKGNSDLVITNIKASCSCTVASLAVGENKSPYFDTRGAAKDWKMEIKPNESAELEVVLDLNHKSVKGGRLIRDVSITSNDPLYSEVSVRVEAEVKD